MSALLVTLVLATAGCFGASVIGTSLRGGLRSWRRLRADRHSLALDRRYLVTMIETPRHDGTPAPTPVLRPHTGVAPAVAAAVATPVRRRTRVSRTPLRAAA
jgi:hypothetical protein